MKDPTPTQWATFLGKSLGNEMLFLQTDAYSGRRNGGGPLGIEGEFFTAMSQCLGVTRKWRLVVDYVQAHSYEGKTPGGKKMLFLEDAALKTLQERGDLCDA
ncbi:hypothetical protein DL762_009836 [Monosporascus cannonballus]|uniref:Uncharacterized protein n=1 Tax=Monosporascus cannonballus TaxID=155416 RepID=A0ABY0GSL1_9PEZI|nr:hypothetical protein DL762_009836 [Monosporascus cannonballus]